MLPPPDCGSSLPRLLLVEPDVAAKFVERLRAELARLGTCERAKQPFGIFRRTQKMHGFDQAPQLVEKRFEAGSGHSCCKEYARNVPSHPPASAVTSS